MWMMWYIKKICIVQSFYAIYVDKKILKLSDFMFLQSGGTLQFVILQRGGTCG